MPVSAHSRVVKLIHAAPMSGMSLALELLLRGSGDVLLADHADDLLLLNQTMDARDPLVGDNCGKTPQCLVVFVDHYNR